MESTLLIHWIGKLLPEDNLGVDLGMAGGVQKVRDEREWIVILFSDFVKASEVNA